MTTLENKKKDKVQIARSVSAHVDAFVKVAVNPSDNLKKMIDKISTKIADEIAVQKGHEVEIPKSTDWELERKAAKLHERTRNLEMIASIDPKKFTQQDKYIILQNAKKNYPTDPDYIAALKAHLYEEKAGGRLSESIKIATSYVSGIVRGAATVSRLAYYSVGGIFSDAMNKKASHSFGQLKEMSKEAYNKTKADLGLVAKSGAGFGRAIWGVVGAALALPTTLLATVATAPYNLVQAIRGEPLLKPRVMYEKIKDALLAPGVVSQGVNSMVVELRKHGKAKNLELAIADLKVHETERHIEAVSIQTSASAKNESTVVMQSLSSTQLASQALAQKNNDIKSTVLKEIQKSFDHAPQLKNLFKHRQSVENAIKLISNFITTNNDKLANSNQFIVERTTDNMQNDIKIALLTLHENVSNNKEMQKFKFNDQPFTTVIDNLLKLNQHEPVIEFKSAYGKFLNNTKTPDREPKLDSLKPFYENLEAIYQNVKTFCEKQIFHDSQKDVIDFVVENPGISLKSLASDIQKLQEIIKLKDIETNSRLDKSEQNIQNRYDLAFAKNLLRGYERLYTATQQANNKLAIYDDIVDKLTGRIVVSAQDVEASLEAINTQAPPPAPPKLNPDAIKKLKDAVDKAADKSSSILILMRGEPEQKVQPEAKHDMAENVVSDPNVTALTAKYIMNTLKLCATDFSAIETLKHMEVLQYSREKAYSLSPVWEKILTEHCKANSVDQTAVFNLGDFIHQDMKLAVPPGVLREVKNEVKSEASLQSADDLSQARIADVAAHTRFYILKDHNCDPAEKANAAAFDVIKQPFGKFDIVTVSLPPAGQAHAVLAAFDENLLKFAHEQLQFYVKHNGTNCPIHIDGSSENLTKAMILLCKAHHIEPRCKSSNYEPSEIEINAVKASSFYSPLREKMDLSATEISALRNSKLATAASKIQNGMLVDPSDLKTLGERAIPKVNTAQVPIEMTKSSPSPRI